MPEEINDSNFEDKVLKSDKPTIVDFWAPWCGPCRMLGPWFAELSEEMKDYSFVKLNVDDNQETAGKYGIRSIPTMLMFKDGEVVGHIVGAYPKDALRQKIEQAFS